VFTARYGLAGSLYIYIYIYNAGNDGVLRVNALCWGISLGIVIRLRNVIWRNACSIYGRGEKVFVTISLLATTQPHRQWKFLAGFTGDKAGRV
jgi:hypothetical protein